MRNTNKGKLLLMIVLTFVLVFVSACSKNEDSEAGSDNTNAAKEQVEVSVGFWDVEKTFEGRDSDEMLKKIETDFEMTFKPINLSWADYSEKLKLWAVSEELPDAFAIDLVGGDWDTYNKWIEQGIVRALPEDLSKYPNLEKFMNQPDIAPLKRDGKFYMIPRRGGNADQWSLERGIIVRKDWMEKLGIPVPTTFEEYKALFKAFADQDPDGNQKDDTIGLTPKTAGMIDAAFMGTSIPQMANGAWVFEDGKWIPPFASKHVVEGIQQLRELYKEGALDPDFALIKGNDAVEKFAQGKAGALGGQIAEDALMKVRDLWDKYNPDKVFEDSILVLPIWENSDGELYRFTTTSYWSETYFSNKVDDEKMDRLLQFFDYSLSQDGMDFFLYGFEGVDYTVDGDKRVITLPKDEKSGAFVNLNTKYKSVDFLKDFAAWQVHYNFDDDLKKQLFGEKLAGIQEEAFKFQMSNAKIIPTNYSINLMSTPAKDKLSSIKYIDEITKIIISDDDPAKMWGDAMKSYEDKGLMQAIQEVNDEAKKQGIE